MKKKINIFDILIIVAIIVLAFTGYKMFSKTGENAALSVSDVSFTVEITNCENDLSSKIQVAKIWIESGNGRKRIWTKKRK